MKVTKRLLAILMSICMMIGMISMTAFAEGEDKNIPSTTSPTGSITIQNPSHSEATVGGKTFLLYKIFNAATNGNNISYSWYQEGEFIPFYDYFYGENGVLGKNDSGSVQAAVDHIATINNNLELSQLAESLHQYIVAVNQAEPGKIQPVRDEISVVEGHTSVRIDDLEYGYYLLYDKTDLGESAVRSAVMLTTVNKDVLITLKANRPELEKTVLENDNKTWGKGTSSQIGDKVKFRIDTYVPSHTLYNAYEYYINDFLPTGLELDRGEDGLVEDGIKVYKVTETVDEKNQIVEIETLIDKAWYTLSIPGDVVKSEDGTTSTTATFKVDFTDHLDQPIKDEHGNVVKDENDNAKLFYNIGDKIRIRYTVTVTSDITAQTANVNTAILSYSNDPTKNEKESVSNSVGQTESSANVYSYQFVFTKFAEDINSVFINKRLVGATFNLYRVREIEEDGQKSEVEELIVFKKQEAENAAHKKFNKYIVADDNDLADENVEKTTDLEVFPEGEETVELDHLNFGGHRGDIAIFGLSEGTYRIKETKAPDGYLLADAKFEINIIDGIGAMGTVSTLEATSSYEGKLGQITGANGQAGQILTVWARITNHPGQALPETGGIGSTIYMVAGLAIMVSAAAVLVYKKRNSAK